MPRLEPEIADARALAGRRLDHPQVRRYLEALGPVVGSPTGRLRLAGV